MMIQRRWKIAALLLALLITACQQENTTSDHLPIGMGGLQMGKPILQNESEIPVILTKAHYDGQPEDLYIRIDQVDNVKKIGYKSYKNYTAMLDEGTPLVLPIGQYQVVAATYDVLKENVERVSNIAYLEGTQSFVIEEKTITVIPAINCTFRCIGIEMRLSDQFQKKLVEKPNYYDYIVTVNNGKATWTFSKGQMKNGYFLDDCEELTVRVKVTLGAKSYPERTYHVQHPTNKKVEIGEHYILTFDAGETSEIEEGYPTISAQCIERR